jgi:glycosyltransferase involved in cell wall biosynthesis
MLKISIIIACLNSSKTIKKTIQSLKNQNYNNLEVIVIDGGSIDNTIQLIKSYKIYHIKIISAPDKGIADAWNKGLKLCSGDIIGILNSDDYYVKNIFSKIEKSFSNWNVPVVGFGNTIFFDPKKMSQKLFKGKNRNKIELLNGFGFLHPSVFFNRKALKKVGLFNTDYRIASDADWLLRAKFLKVNFKKIPSISYMLSGGISSKSKYAAMGEYMDALVKNGYSEFYISLFLFLRFLGKIKQTIF